MNQLRRALSHRRSALLSVALVLVGLGLVSSASASAATSFALGRGGSPHVAMAGGTAHVAWLHAIAGARLEIRYCRLPEAATACSAAHTFAPDPESRGVTEWSAPFVLAGPGDRVVIVSGFGGRITKAFVSSDGGTRFAPPRQIGTVVPRGPGGVAAGPGPDDISLLGTSGTTNAVVAYQRGRLSGAPETAEAALPSDVSVGYAWNVALSGSLPVAAYSGASNTQVTYHTGIGDNHAPSHWVTPFSPPPPDGDGSQLVGGASGVYLMHNEHPGARWLVSRFTNGGLAPAAVVPGSAASDNGADLFEDAAGGLHVVYNVLRPTGGDPPVIGLRYASSADGGASWSAPGDVIREVNVSDFVVGASGPGQGVVLWATSPNDDGTIKAARLASLIPVGGGPPGLQPPTPVVDTTAPAVNGFSMTKRRFSVSRRPATAFRYTLSEQASVAIAIERALPGRRARRNAGPCVRPTRALRRSRRCTRHRLRGTIRTAGHAGANALPFGGRIGSRTLAPGRYRASILASDAAGNRSQMRRLTFTIVRRSGRARTR